MEASQLLTHYNQRIIDVYLDSVPSFQEKGKGYVLFCKVQRAMRHVPDFIETCKAILDAVMEEMDAENCSLMLKNSITGELSVRAARGKNEGESTYYSDCSDDDGKRFKLGEGIAGFVLKEGRGVMVNDVSREPRFVRSSASDLKLKSLVCFPIRESNQVIGVFNISHSMKGAFDENDRLAVSYVSNQFEAVLTFAHLLSERKGMISIPHAFTPIEVREMNLNNGSGMFICASDKMRRIKEIIDRVANTDATVFIRGESGVGKEVVARSIHLSSFRREKPFVKVNCAALPQELLESELFGYEKGAFTGASHQKPGKFELAHGGTIFLDEIIEMSPPLQAKLLHVLQDGEFSKLGSKKDVRVDVRVLAATNKKIEEVIKNGQFREDLYYRLNVVNILVPPLRERKEEILIFVEYFLDKYGKKYNKEITPLTDQTMRALLQYRWLGNVRELENLIQRYVILGDEQVIVSELISATKIERIQEKGVASPRGTSPSLKEVHREAVMNAESEVIRKALELTNWNRRKAAGMLNISYKALLYKIKACNIDKSTSFPSS